MKKTLLLKYIQGCADKSEQEEVLRWAEKDRRNMDYLVSLKVADVASGMLQQEKA